MQQASQQAKQQTRVNRVGESGDVPPRRTRFYMRDDQWFYQTRHGQEHGPYKTLIEAKRALSLYLRRSGIVRFSL